VHPLAGNTSSELSVFGAKYEAENDFDGNDVSAFTADCPAVSRQDILSVRSPSRA